MTFAVANDSYQESLATIAAQHEDWIIQQAIALLEKRIFKGSPSLNCPAAVRDYLRLKLIPEPNEVFAVVFINNQNQVLAYEPMFKGTVNSTTVHSRVVVQRALELNAVSVVLSHQHPSGLTKPSRADCALTLQLRSALALVDVQVLDHIIVGQGEPYSFAESGLL